MRLERLFHQIYGPGLAYSGFAPPGASRWLPNDKLMMLAISGNQIVVAGDMPMLCAAGSASAAGLDLLREAGFDLPGHLRTFRHAEDYQAQLTALVESGLRIVVQHVHPPEMLPAEACWIAPSLLSWLNDKGNLADLVAPAHVPKRIVLGRDATDRRLPDLAFPFLLKAATLESTGGGALDICICRDRQELELAAEAFRGSERVVAEEWLPARRFLCLNYAVGVDGGTSYLGGAEIVNDPSGRYLGNWLGEDLAISTGSEILGRRIAEQGASLGFRGCLCVDVAELPDGGLRAFDLNFRICGSTVSLLAFKAVRQVTGARVARFRTWSRAGDFSELVASARQAMRSGFFMPLGSFDPQPHGSSGATRISGLILGDDRAEVLRRAAELESLGWC